jgi:hypothetical protein
VGHAVRGAPDLDAIGVVAQGLCVERAWRGEHDEATERGAKEQVRGSSHGRRGETDGAC